MNFIQVSKKKKKGLSLTVVLFCLSVFQALMIIQALL